MIGDYPVGSAPGDR